MARKKAEQPVMRGVKAADPFDGRELYPPYVAASVLQGEPASSAYNNNTGRDFEQTARGVVGTMYRAANINATVCTSQVLRLYRKAGASGSRKYLGRRVTDRRKMAYLMGDTAVQPTRCKGANYAAKSGAEIEEVLDHPVLDVLQNPDPVYTGQIWMQLIWWFKEVCGRAYLYGADRVGRVPTSLYILPSCYTWPVKSTTGLISEFVYARNRTAMMRCKPEDVVYLRHQANPFDPVGAMSWTSCVTFESDMEAAALQAEVARWNNGGMPGMVLKAPPTTNDQQMAQMQAALSNRIQGVGKSGSMLLLRDTELIQYATKPHDMQYVEGMSSTEKRIYDAAGIPESIYRLNSANLASATVADGQYNRLTIAPRLATMASELTELLLPMFGIEPGEMWFTFDSPVRDDVLALAEQYRQGELSGIVYPNEYRHVLGLEALPDDVNRLRYRQVEAHAPMTPLFDNPPPKPDATDTASVDAASVDMDDESDAEGNEDDTVTKSVTTKADSQTPTDSMADEAQRGLDWREEFGRGGTEIGVARARDIVNKRGLSLDTVYRMVSYFARHEVDKQGQGWSPDQDGYPSAGRIAWALWGGDPGRTWAEKIVNQAERDEDTKAAASCGHCKCGTRGGDGAVVSGSAGVDVADTRNGARTSDPAIACKSEPELTTKTLAGGIEWDDIAGVPKATVRIMSAFSTEVATWYAATIPTMINDQVTPPAVMTPDAAAGVASAMTMPITTEQAAEFEKITNKYLERSIMEGAAVGITRLADPENARTFDTANEPAMKYIRDRGLELAKSVPDTMKGHVQAAIESELGRGTTVNEIKNAITKQAPELSGYQAERIARTETSIAFNQGQRLAWADNGVEGRQVLTAGDPCPICTAVADKYRGVTLPMTDPYMVGADAWMSPPFHPNCRCGEMPVQYLEPEQ
jgi:HK97 family phage portal protein